jgi:hypothetical protein
MRGRLAPTLITVVLLAACSAAPQPAPVVYPLGEREIVLRVTASRGHVQPGAELGIGMITVYGDGLVIEPGKSSDSAIPAIQQRRLTASGMRRLVEAAEAAHLHEALDLGDPLAADAGVLVVTLSAQGRQTVTKMIAPEVRGGSLSGRQEAARQRVQDFVQSLERLDDWLEGEVSRSGEAYAYKVMAVLASPRDDTVADRMWPFVADLGDGVRIGSAACTLVAGPQLATLQLQAAGGNPMDRWANGGKVYRLVFRPLLPHEQGCASLTSALS